MCSSCNEKEKNKDRFYLASYLEKTATSKNLEKGNKFSLYISSRITLKNFKSKNSTTLTDMHQRDHQITPGQRHALPISYNRKPGLVNPILKSQHNANQNHSPHSHYPNPDNTSPLLAQHHNYTQ